jgi:hypothetical protein
VSIELAYPHCGKSFQQAKLWEASGYVGRAMVPSLARIGLMMAGVKDQSASQVDQQIQQSYVSGLDYVGQGCRLPNRSLQGSHSRRPACGRLRAYDAAPRSCPSTCASAADANPHQVSLPASPLNGPAKSGVTQPP